MRLVPLWHVHGRGGRKRTPYGSTGINYNHGGRAKFNPEYAKRQELRRAMRGARWLKNQYATGKNLVPATHIERKITLFRHHEMHNG